MKKRSTRTSIMLLALFLIVAGCMPLFLKKQYYTNLMVQVLINIIIVTGLNFITGLTGQMNLGTAGIFALGAYTSALLTTKLGINPWLGLLASILMGCIIGIGLGYPSLRLKGVYLALTTIGFSEVVRIFITNLIDLTGGSAGINRIPPFTLFGHAFTDNVSTFYLYLAITAILLIFAQRVVKSKWGRMLKAIKDNPEALETSGVNVAWPKILAFTLAAVYGCIAGCLYAHFIRFIFPDEYTINFSINYVIMLVIGGVGSVPGAVLGTLLVMIVPEVLRFLENYYWLLFSIITLLFVIFLPNGLASIFSGDRRKSRLFSRAKSGSQKTGKGGRPQ